MISKSLPFTAHDIYNVHACIYIYDIQYMYTVYIHIHIYIYYDICHLD